MTIKQYAYRICIECKMRPQNSGFQCLVDAIDLAYHDRTYLNGFVTKRLYPDVAKLNNSTGIRVERTMRHAVENSISKHNNSNFIISAISFIDYCKHYEENEENYQRAKSEVFNSFFMV